jgi:NADPH-dependent glutamate synthase beta subunit-like oxidoreductase
MRSAGSDVNIIVNPDRCYACGECVDRCILDNLRMKLAPCRAACPIHMNCQGYVRLIAQGDEEQAAHEMRKFLPFAGIVGRVCTRPCEDKCERRSIDQQPVHIRALKRYLADAYLDIARVPAATAKASGKRVAIVGSGPAGLMAAYELAAKGHGVVVFEAASEPGGMLRWGIPEFRLPSSEVSHCVRMLAGMGIVFKTGIRLGTEMDPEKLESEWDAILLATGGGGSAKLGIPGEGLPGVHHGIELLRKVREGHTVDMGKSVLVIGGGNAAVDAALVCRKLGADDVSIICLEEKLQMPAFRMEIAEAVEEGVKIVDSRGPKRIIRNSGGQLTIEMSRCIRVFDEEGRFCPELEDTCELSPCADSIVVAIGQRRDSSTLPSEFREGDGSDPLTLQTKRPRIFMAGDAVTGPSSVIDAMAQGREAAVSMDRFLSGEALRWGRAFWGGAYITDFAVRKENFVTRPRAVLPRLPIEERTMLTEVEKTMDRKTACAEAERCLGCGQPAEFNQTCWYCLPCEIDCPADALEVRMPYLVR